MKTILYVIVFSVLSSSLTYLFLEKHLTVANEELVYKKKMECISLWKKQYEVDKAKSFIKDQLFEPEYSYDVENDRCLYATSQFISEEIGIYSYKEIKDLYTNITLVFITEWLGWADWVDILEGEELYNSIYETYFK